MGDNLLQMVVKFTTMDGLSEPLKKMIGLGKSAKGALGDLYKEAKGLKAEMSALDAEIKKTGTASAELVAKQERLAAAMAGVNRRLETQKRLMAIDARTARITGRASAMKSEGMSTLMGTMLMAAPVMAVMHEASAYQRELARIDALGLGKGVVQQADRFARGAKIIGNSTRDMAHAYGDAMAIFKDTKEADFVAPIIGKMHFANKVMYGEEGGRGQPRS